MTSSPYYTRFSRLKQRDDSPFQRRFRRKQGVRPDLYQLAQGTVALPRFVQDSPVALRYLRLLGALDWSRFPERDLNTAWTIPPAPFAPFVAACLVKLNEQFVYMPQLRDYLVEHPALTWALGFPLLPSRHAPCGFDVQASLPTARHFTRMLRKLPNTLCQYLLDETVRLLQAELSTEVKNFGHAISLDTKHILAWVKENNPKAYLKRSERYDKTRQPAGDPDCRLGCKQRRNQRASSEAPPPTPPDNPVPANTISVGEYYWGYASGVVATKIPGWGEFVLAELTQSFDRPDVSYFHPLMAETERRLGFRPKFGALDAGFDAFYTFEYFYREGQENLYSAFAAIPFSLRGGHKKTFDEAGLPLCQAGLAMPLKSTFWSKSALVHHERGRYACPLLFPQETGQACPIDHKNWPKGCTTTLPTSIGARIRYQLDRESEAYQHVYKQRTATERINAQAVALGIERPKLRNQQAITNQNTLIYVLINLRALHRVQQQKQEAATV